MRRHTVCWPRLRPTRQWTPSRADAGCLEPYIASWIPRVDVRAVRNFRHIELYRAKMRDLALSHEAQLCAGFNSCSAASCPILKAPHVWRRHGCHTRVRLVVLRLAYGDPFFGFWSAIYDDLGEAVCLI